MALDIDNIYDSVRDTIIYAVGNRLSKLNTPSGQIPAIIRAREDGLKPEHTYITVDVEDIKLPSGWLLDSDTDSTTGKTKFTILYEVYIATTAYGDVSKSVLQEYHARLCFDEAIRAILQDKVGMSIHKLSEIKNIPTLIKTNHEERSLLRLRCYIHDIIEVDGYVSSIGISEGMIYDDVGNLIKNISISVNDNP